MNEEREDKLTGSLRQKMAPTRAVPFERLGRAEFEQRFVAPFRKSGFSFWKPLVVFGGGVAFAASLIAVNFFGQSFFSGEALVANQNLKVRREGLWFGSRSTVTATVLPRRDRVQIDEAKPVSFAWGSFATVVTANAGFKLLLYSRQDTAVDILTGKALFRFGKSDMRRSLVIAGAHTLQITGTIVYVDVAAQTVAIIEGQTILDAKTPVTAGEEINLVSGQKRKLTTATTVTVRALAPGILAEEQIDNSPEARLFRLYGNVYAVTLQSGTRILASKVVEDGNLRLFTLGGPLYVAENEIAQMKKLR